MLLPKKVLVFTARRVLTKVEHIKSLNQAVKKTLMNNIKLLDKYLQKSKNTVSYMEMGKWMWIQVELMF